MRKINKIIIHCAAADIVDKDLEKIVRNWHNSRGFNGIGYHYMIRKDGGIIIGRPIEKIGAHAKGHNRDSIGIMLNGDKKFTDLQYKELSKLCYNLLNIFKLKKDNIHPHYEFNINKTCPNFDVDKFIMHYMVY